MVYLQFLLSPLICLAVCLWDYQIDNLAHGAYIYMMGAVGYHATPGMFCLFRLPCLSARLLVVIEFPFASVLDHGFAHSQWPFFLVGHHAVSYFCRADIVKHAIETSSSWTPTNVQLPSWQPAACAMVALRLLKDSRWVHACRACRQMPLTDWY